MTPNGRTPASKTQGKRRLVPLPPEGFLHIPMRRRLTQAEQQSRPPVSAARCSCGFEAPAVEGDALEHLASIHPANEPIGCALCGHVTPQGGSGARPWVRYVAQELDGGWVYVCGIPYSCAQRQRAVREEPPMHAGEPFWPTLLSGGDVNVSLDDGFEVMTNAWDLQSAIALYQLARGQLPRTWEEIQPAPADQRALLAMVVAQAAIRDITDSILWKWVLCARRAGVPWDHLVEATVYDDVESLREHVLGWADNWDWGSNEQRDAMLALLSPDPGKTAQ